MDLQITEKLLSEKQALLTLGGQMNAVTAPELKGRLKALAAGGWTQLVIDMGGVSFVDSSGLAALVAGLKAVRGAGGSLKLAAVGEQARAVFKLTMLERIFEFYPSAEVALNG